MMIGELARKVGVNPQTLRFYERKGLLLPPHRHGSGKYRDYDESALHRVRFILSAKKAGFTLGNIRELLDAQNDAEPCPKVAALAEGRLHELDNRIAELKGFREHLALLRDECQANEIPEQCPAIGTFRIRS